MLQQSSSLRVGVLLIHRPASVDKHTGGSRLTPTVHETDINTMIEEKPIMMSA